MTTKPTIVCKNPSKVSLKKLSIDRDMLAILYHDFIALCEVPVTDNPREKSLRSLEVAESNKDNPWMSILTCSISHLQKLRKSDTSIVITVWEMELSVNFATHSIASVWHYELTSRINVIDKKNYGSFASPKPCPEGTIEFYHCGQEYFSAVADAMEAATTSIMITDWWFSPQIYLKRDTFPLPQKYRLDNLLQAKAQQGVKVYIMVFKENELAINLGSKLAKAYMESLDKNISFIAHGPPNWAKVWYSHHQKTVIVDQNISFVGGIDLCFGRYDTTSHPLVDSTLPYTFVGADYYNQFQVTVTGAAMTKPFLDLMDKDRPMRETIPREPWNDVHARVVGGAARDVGLNFIQRWAAHQITAGTPYESFMTLNPIPIPIPSMRPPSEQELLEQETSLSEADDDTNIVRFGDQIRLWAWSPACAAGVAGGYVGIDKKHKLCGLGPGSIDRFGPLSFRVMSAEEAQCTKAGCSAFTDHPDVRACPKHADYCAALSCSAERLKSPDSDYCEEHHFSASIRALPPPVLYGDKLVLVSDQQLVWNNDVRTTWFQGYIKLDRRGVEGEMYVTFVNNPNLPAKASKPINFYDSGVSIRVLSSHRATVDLNNVITLYPKRKTQGFLGCSGGSPLTFTLHHAGPSEAEQQELDALNTRIQQLQIKTRVLKEAVTKYEPGPARDNIVRNMEEAEKSLAESIEERRHPKWRFTATASDVSISASLPPVKRDSLPRDWKEGLRDSFSGRDTSRRNSISRSRDTTPNPDHRRRDSLDLGTRRDSIEPVRRDSFEPSREPTFGSLRDPSARRNSLEPVVTLRPNYAQSTDARDSLSVNVSGSPQPPSPASSKSSGCFGGSPPRSPSASSGPTLTIETPLTGDNSDNMALSSSASSSSAPSSPRSPAATLTTSLSAPTLAREEDNSETEAKDRPHQLRNFLSAPSGGKVRVHVPSPRSSPPSNSAPEITRTCQVLRSLTNTWSGGNFKEFSILTAYLHAIAESKRFIYIEQQFFVSTMDDPSHPVRNLVAKALFDRISQAILDHEAFCVVVVLPISPEGNFQDRSVRLVMHYQRCSIDRGKFSLMKQLEARFQDVQISQYLSFYGLRTFDPAVLDAKGRPRTMQIYVHSKLLICDDRVMIIGSANINDRSLSGNRDSEICLRVEEPVGCGSNSIQSFRRRLWANYLAVADVGPPEALVPVALAAEMSKEAELSREAKAREDEESQDTVGKVKVGLQMAENKVSEGLQKVEEAVVEGLHKAEALFDKVRHKEIPKPSLDVLDLEDAASAEVQAMWRTRSQVNTAAYQACYPNLPHSSIRTHAQLNSLNSQAGNPEVLAAVKGFVVHFPRLFLDEETMMPDFLDKENLVPADCYT